MFDRLAEHYYEPAEVQQMLGIDRDRLNYLVRSRQLERVRIAGKPYIKRRQVDLMAAEIEAALLTADASTLTFRLARCDDLGDQQKLVALHFGDQRAHAMADGFRAMMESYPEMTYQVYDGRFLVASMDLLPLSEEGIHSFRTGERGWKLREYLQPLRPDEPTRLIIINFLTTTLVSPSQQHQYAAFLLSHMARVWEHWGERGIHLVSCDACGGTIYGRKTLEKAGFTYLGEPRPGRWMYTLDIETAHLHMLRPYKAAYAAWKRNKEEREH